MEHQGHGTGGHFLLLWKCHTPHVVQNSRLVKERASTYNVTLQELATR